MKWVTRRHIRVNRAATAWLVRRFIDPAASFVFCAPEDVAGFQEGGAIGFDAPGARYPHKDGRGRCSFEALVDEHVAGDGALRRMAAIVHGADFCDVAHAPPESAGLRAISHSFPALTTTDEETLAKASFLYDALYATLAEADHELSPVTRTFRDP
jgi:hypothetical protein